MRSLRAWGLRRLLGRLHVGDEVVRHLSTFQRLGATLEVAPPLEMLPVGARTIFRAVRTRAAADIRRDWLWPDWLERQLDPADPAFTPRGHLPVMHNVTHRNWTAVGNPGFALGGDRRPHRPGDVIVRQLVPRLVGAGRRRVALPQPRD